MGIIMVQALIDELFMPAVRTSGLPHNVRSHVEQGVEEVRREDPVGIENERYTGSVPVHIDRNPPYKGVTEFRPGYHGPEAKRMGISDRVHPREAKRVAKHEARHVRSEKLLKYADVPQGITTLVMESYAEFGGMKAAEKAGNYAEARQIEETTPYKNAVRFGKVVDRNYVSDRDGKRGYEAFIRDIIRNRSMARTFGRLRENIKASIGVGYSRN